MSDAAAVKAPNSFGGLTVKQGSSQHRMFQLFGWGVFALVAIIVPYVLPNFRVSQVAQAIAFGVAILGMNLVIGYGGLISLGHVAFMGMGAYTTTILVNDSRWDVWMTLPVVVVVCFLFGLAVGMPALKIKGLYLALVTFALAYTFPILLKIESGGIARRTGGDNGKNLAEGVKPPEWARAITGTKGKTPPQQIAIYQYWCLLILAALCFLVVRNLIKSRPGRALIAIRDNQIGAAVSGVNLSLYKVTSFGISASITGLGGSMLAVVLNSVGPTSFDANYAILLIMGLVLGGVATLHGCWIGGLLMVFIQDLSSRVKFTAIPFFKIEKGSPLTRAVFGLVLVLVAFFIPGGVMAGCKRLKAKLIRVIPTVPEAPAVESGSSPVGVAESSLSGATR